MSKKNSNNSSELRKQAEARLKKRFDKLDDLHDDDPQRLIHELRVHQVELEMQNEELRVSQTELEESRAIYSDLYDFAPVGYFTFDKTGLIIKVNLTGAGQLGVERNMLIKKPFSSYIHKDDQDVFYLHRGRVFETSVLQTCELRLKRKDGAEFYAQLESIALKDCDNCCRTAVSDILARKLVQEALRISSERYRSYIEVTGELGWTTNADGEVVEDLPSWRQYTGQTYEEIKCWGWSKALHPDDLEHTAEQWRKAVKEKSKYEVEYRIRRHDGVYRHFMARGILVFNEDGSIMEWVGTCVDITDRKQTEEALRRSNSFNQSIIDSSSDCIKTLDMNGRLQYMSPGGQRLLGIKDIGTYLNVPYEEFWKGSDREAVIEVIQKAKQGQSGSFQGFCPTADGIPKWWDVCISPVLDADGRPERLLAVSHDITERTKAEEERNSLLEELKNSNQELEQFAYIASHDLQEPLRMVTSYLDLLNKRYRDKLEKNAGEFIDYASSGAAHMHALLNDLLMYSRVGSKGKPFELTDLNLSINSAISNLRKTIEESRTQITSGNLPGLYADETQMVQLFQNLLANAIKFRGDKAPVIRVSAEWKDTEWLIKVSDSGIGIDPKFFDKIFLIFQRLHSREKYPGTGIGLAVCKKIVERHGGRIWVESGPGKGSTFYFTLPQKG